MNHWPRASLFTKSSYFTDALFTMALISAVIYPHFPDGGSRLTEARGGPRRSPNHMATESAKQASNTN